MKVKRQGECPIVRISFKSSFFFEILTSPILHYFLTAFKSYKSRYSYYLKPTHLWSILWHIISAVHLAGSWSCYGALNQSPWLVLRRVSVENAPVLFLTPFNREQSFIYSSLKETFPSFEGVLHSVKATVFGESNLFFFFFACRYEAAKGISLLISVTNGYGFLYLVF